jgi:O-acetyl-ADP-ribose deacetylase (regulator of RNase III)
VRVADIWVNSENNNMEMSRWYEGTISGMIRYLGAKKDDGGEITENGDIIARELKEKLGKRNRVEPTTVLMTSPGELAKKPYNVKAIIHVASVQGTPGRGYRPIDNVEDCVTKALELAETENATLQECKSVVFPLLGTGTGQAQIDVVAQKLLTRAINHLESNRDGRIECVYFLAWTNLHLESCKDVLRKCGKVDIRD